MKIRVSKNNKILLTFRGCFMTQIKFIKKIYFREGAVHSLHRSKKENLWIDLK